MTTKLEMTKEQEEHLAEVETIFIEMLDKKYRKGAHEHGGNLWDMGVEELLENALDEAIDQVTYLATLLQKVRGKKTERVHV
jgi:Rod binding domain-containing protein